MPIRRRGRSARTRRRRSSWRGRLHPGHRLERLRDQPQDRASELVKSYNSPSVGPNGVTVVRGVVYGNTGDSAFAIAGQHRRAAVAEEADAQRERGHRHGAGHQRRHASTSRPCRATRRASTRATARRSCGRWTPRAGDVKWKWDEVPTNLWSDKYTNINSGGGQWDPPSFDANGDVYVGVSNPAPFPGTKVCRRASAIPAPTCTPTRSSSSTTTTGSSTGTTS